MTFLVDSSVWLALSIPAHQHHAVCRAWFDSVDEPDSINFCRITQQALLRLLTNRVIMARYGAAPRSNTAAWTVYDALLDDDRVVCAEEPPKTESEWRTLSQRNTASTNVWTDAYLAAFAKTGGHTMVTTDGAFRQFDGLDVLVLGS